MSNLCLIVVNLVLTVIPSDLLSIPQQRVDRMLPIALNGPQSEAIVSNFSLIVANLVLTIYPLLFC